MSISIATSIGTSIASSMARFARRTARALARAAVLLVLAVPCAAHADTVASLLGNFTVNQYVGARLHEGAVDVRYTVVFGQLPALRELHVADADGDGVTTQQERNAYASAIAPQLAERLRVVVDGARVAMQPTRWTTSLPTELGGFSLRVDVDLSGALPVDAAARAHRLELSNENFTGRFGWQEIVVEATGVAVYDTNAFATSLTNDLTEALPALPAAGPLAERAVHLSYSHGVVPAGAMPLAARPGTGRTRDAQASLSPEPPAAGRASVAPMAPAPDAKMADDAASGFATSNWLARQTQRVLRRISAPSVPLHVAVFALLAACVLGALHAFAPGHGKTIVGAYLVGSRGTPRHALFLGTIVTITHTLGVFALGLATLVASRYFMPERIVPVLSVLSGVLVVGMGLVLLRQRWSETLRARQSANAPAVYRALRPASPRTALRGTGVAPLALAIAHGHAHGVAHGHGGLVHSHGGRAHSHLPPGGAGEAVTWRGLLALGVSGGLVPCPSALVLLLAAVALHKTAYGLLLVLAFSVGLAATLTAVGIAFLYARDRLGRPSPHARWARLLPLASAGAITLVGVLMCYGAILGPAF